jgi:shikimate kinase
MATNNLILIGFMGAGKTSIAKELSSLLTFSVTDTDILIERQEDQSIADIFKTHGEAYFRQCEAGLIPQLQALDRTIIATGGGFPIQETVASKLPSFGHCIYLETSFETCLSRIQSSAIRPLLTEDHRSLERLYQDREPFYQDLADVRVSTENLSIQDVAKTCYSEYTKCIDKP